MAAIVANLNQPDFSDSFVSWLRTVPKYPRAFDLKFESIASILDLNIPALFGDLVSKEAVVCPKCKLQISVDEFEQEWKRRLDALKFATTVYLKEPHGLAGKNSFVIEQGNSDCRFNIFNYLAPFWNELTSGEQEFHVSFNTENDSSDQDLNLSELDFSDNQAFFIKRFFNEIINNRKPSK